MRHSVKPSPRMHRAITWFTAKHFRLKLIGIILFAIILLIGGKYLFFGIAKHTFLREFYTKVEIAREQAKPLKLNNYLGEDESSLAPGFWGQLVVKGAYIGDCLRVNYTSGNAGGRRHICERSFNTYYGLSRVEPQALEAAHSELLMRGWNLVLRDDNSIQVALENYNQNKPVYLIYSNQDNLRAILTTHSLPQPSKCDGDSACVFAQKDITKPYDVLLVLRIAVDNQ